MLFRRHSRGENSRVGQVLVAWFRDFGRASRPWLRRARRRDSWRSLRPTKVAGLHDANAKSLWNLLTRENAARIRKEDRSRSRSFSEKNFDPDSVGSETKINGETRETRGWLWKGRTGDESSGSLCPAFRAVKRAGNVVNFAHIILIFWKSIFMEWMERNCFVFFSFVLRVNICCVYFDDDKISDIVNFIEEIYSSCFDWLKY